MSETSKNQENKPAETGVTLTQAEPKGEPKKEPAVSTDSADPTEDARVYDEGYVKIVFRKPINFDGETVKELTLDLDSLTAKDLMNAEREAKARLAKKQRLEMPKEADSKYTACVAAKASGVKTELIYSLNSQDFVTVTMAVMAFLLGGESLDGTED